MGKGNFPAFRCHVLPTYPLRSLANELSFESPELGDLLPRAERPEAEGGGNPLTVPWDLPPRNSAYAPAALYRTGEGDVVAGEEGRSWTMKRRDGKEPPPPPPLLRSHFANSSWPGAEAERGSPVPPRSAF